MTTPPPGDDRRYWLDDPNNVRRVVQALAAVCAIAFLASALAVGHGFAIESVFGFFCAFGFLAIVVLITGAKAMRRVLMRPETFYDDDRY